MNQMDYTLLNANDNPARHGCFVFDHKKVKFVFSHVLFYEILNMCAIL